MTPTSGVKGITAKLISTTTMMMAGASTKVSLSANGGTQSSLVKILIMSATTCSKPNQPTRFGPRRSCQKLSKRRSTQINMAPSTMTTNRMEAILKADPTAKVNTC